MQVFNALTTTIGVAGWYYSALGAFDPIAVNKCGSIRGALRRYSSGAQYVPMLAFLAGTNVTTAMAYILGLSGSDPYQIVLRKGLLTGGLAPTDADVLRVSDESFTSNTLWHHLKLDVLVNPQGDVVLNVYKSDLALNLVTAPDWQPISGMESFIDDSNGVITGTAPLVSGFRGVMAHLANGSAGKASFIDHVRVFRQLTP